MVKIKRCLACDSEYKGKICKVCGLEEVKIPKEKKAKEPPPPKEPKPEKTEAELVRKYADVIMAKQRTRGMLNKNFKDLEQANTLNKNLWRDSDFYFSIVFQSSLQKYKFLEFLQEKFDFDSGDNGVDQIKIVNGLKLAEFMGLELAKEATRDYPTSNLDLVDMILDEETL